MTALNTKQSAFEKRFSILATDVNSKFNDIATYLQNMGGGNTSKVFHSERNDYIATSNNQNMNVNDKNRDSMISAISMNSYDSSDATGSPKLYNPDADPDSNRPRLASMPSIYERGIDKIDESSYSDESSSSEEEGLPQTQEQKEPHNNLDSKVSSQVKQKPNAPKLSIETSANNTQGVMPAAHPSPLYIMNNMNLSGAPGKNRRKSVGNRANLLQDKTKFQPKQLNSDGT